MCMCVQKNGNISDFIYQKINICYFGGLSEKRTVLSVENLERYSPTELIVKFHTLNEYTG